MTHDPFERLMSSLSRGETLSSDERARMRSVVSEYMAFRPLPRKPTSTSWLAQLRFVVTSRSTAMALSALLVVAVTGAGVAQAAEGALPGDPLYGMKVGIMEPLLLSLSSGPAKNAWERTFAERRLSEAAQLATQGRLSPSVEATLTTNFSYYAQLALAEPKGQAASSTRDISGEDFSARLSAYDTVLAHLDTKAGHVTADTLHGAIRQVTAIAASSTETVEHDDSTEAASLETVAHDALDTSTTLLGSLKTAVTTTTSAHANKELERASDLQQQGSELLKQHDVRGASKAFKASLRASTRVNILTHAAATLHIDAFDHEDDAATSSILMPPAPAKGSLPEKGEEESDVDL